MDQAQFGIHEVEIVMQALAAVRAQVGLVRLLVMPGLIGVAGLHRRNDVRQTRMIAAPLEHLGDHGLLAHMAPGNVLDGHARLSRH
jgi:hypothetical protein